MSDDTPIHTDLAFREIMSREFLPDLEPASDSEIPVYGCRVLFYRTSDPTEHTSQLIPWLTYDLSQAEVRRSEIAHRMSARTLRGLVNYGPSWTPMAVRVVQLAEVPF